MDKLHQTEQRDLERRLNTFSEYVINAHRHGDYGAMLKYIKVYKYVVWLSEQDDNKEKNGAFTPQNLSI